MFCYLPCTALSESSQSYLWCLLPVVVNSEAWEWLSARCAGDPHLGVSVDLDHNIVDVACPRAVNSPFPASFSVDRFARRCLLEGRDPLSYLLDAMPTIQAYEAQRA